MSNIQIFNYQSNEVRTVEMGGEPWFVLKDVCNISAWSMTAMLPHGWMKTKRVSARWTPLAARKM